MDRKIFNSDCEGVAAPAGKHHVVCSKDMKEIRFCNMSGNKDPMYEHPDGDSGFDLRAWIEDGKPIVLKPLERALVHTGIRIDVPEDCEIQVRPKSGRALKEGLSVLNTPGTVDENYYGEVCVIAVNLSNEDIVINPGDKVAQAVLCPVFGSGHVCLTKVDEIAETGTRGSKGFGSTGN